MLTLVDEIYSTSQYITTNQFSDRKLKKFVSKVVQCSVHDNLEAFSCAGIIADCNNIQT
jgi:uncharacterized OsmC-like protein